MPEDEARNLAARADFCRLLAACYYEPGLEFAEEKVFDSMLAAADCIDPELAEGTRRLGAAFAAVPVDDLRVEYLRLFLGPVDAPARPYGSLWLGPEKALMQDSTMEVQSLYEEGGFEIAEDFRELPDHIAVELEFLYLLLFKANHPTHTEEATTTGSMRRRLLGEHLQRWVTPFTEAVAQATKCAFYRELAEITRQFVRMEARRVLPA